MPRRQKQRTTDQSLERDVIDGMLDLSERRERMIRGSAWEHPNQENTAALWSNPFKQHELDNFETFLPTDIISDQDFEQEPGSWHSQDSFEPPLDRQVPSHHHTYPPTNDADIILRRDPSLSFQPPYRINETDQQVYGGGETVLLPHPPQYQSSPESSYYNPHHHSIPVLTHTQQILPQQAQSFDYAPNYPPRIQQQQQQQQSGVSSYIQQNQPISSLPMIPPVLPLGSIPASIESVVDRRYDSRVRFPASPSPEYTSFDEQSTGQYFSNSIYARGMQEKAELKMMPLKKSGSEQITNQKKKSHSQSQPSSAGSSTVPPLPQSQSSSSSSNNNNKGEDDEKAPLPQNLRGDPFRSAKVKTELCRHFGTPKGCPFGDKCNYAHGVHELKYTKLMSLERAGLVDVEIFRIHPCPIWVATGSCPFDQRCSGIHDPRVIGSHQSWLPHAETLVNSVVQSGKNIDKLYHQQLSAVYSCSPIYRYFPSKRWKSDRSSTFLSWRELYAFISNLKENASSWDYRHNPIMSNATDSFGYPVQGSFLKEKSRNQIFQELINVSIAIKMRERRCGQCYAYMPSHLLFGELCMVLQIRFFNVQQMEDSAIPKITEIEYNSNSNTPGITIRAHEIAFGPIGDPGVRQVSVWLNIDPEDILPCTSQQAKRHKRSRHRLKKKISRGDSSLTTPSVVASSGDATRAPQGAAGSAVVTSEPGGKSAILTPLGDDLLRKKKKVDSPVPFLNYQPIDNAAFDLITATLKHRSQVLQFWLSESSSPHHLTKKAISLLESVELRLLSTYESQRRHWMTWRWTVNKGRGIVDEDTDVPPVNGVYCFPYTETDEQALCSRHFYGIDDEEEGEGSQDIISEYAKLSSYLIWKSFVRNMLQLGGSKMMKRWPEDNPEYEMPYPPGFPRRLPILEQLSLNTTSRSSSLDTTHGLLPRLNSNNVLATTTPTNEPFLDHNQVANRNFKNLFHDWDEILDRYHPSRKDNICKEATTELNPN